MTNLREFSDLLAATAAELDIPDDLHEAASLKYEEVGVWLASEESSLVTYAPDIYPQGSFRLGTVVKPIDVNCDYDIDLVCVIERQKTAVTQAGLKEMIGNRLRDNVDYARVLSPSRRCWNLSFPKQFHLDVLPSIPNVEQEPNGILLTDTELKLWQKSNPIDYADWFYDSMRPQVIEFRDSLAKSLAMNVEDVPEWQVKTPLQRAIQILKRHRDVKFKGDPENRPVSIILTTLAAQAYRGEGTVYESLLRLVSDMPNFVEMRQGRYWVANPVEPDENFADKWNEKPERRDAFLKWLVLVKADFTAAAGSKNLDEAAFLLKRQMASNEVDSARAKLFREGLAMTKFAGSPVKPEVTKADHSQRPTWPMLQRYRASIKATLHYARGGRKISALASRRIGKNLWLKFSLETNAPYPYQVYWKVVNTGPEARAANQLRGSIFPDDSAAGNLRWEHTAYSGTHWVEAYVVKDGQCVALSAPKYVMVR
jgi:hypothetical protein